MRSIVWLRRDLRLDDNVALFKAACASEEVCLAFVVDPALLRSQRIGAPLAIAFFSALAALRERLRALGSDLAILEDELPERALAALAERIGARAVFFNLDYDPSAVQRDARATEALRAENLHVSAFVDHVVFAAEEIDQNDGRPYRVFTPYKRRWLDRYRFAPRLPVASERAVRRKLLRSEAIGGSRAVPQAREFGFADNPRFPRLSERRALQILTDFTAEGGGIARYGETRDLPAADATSRLSPHLRAGTIGIRTCVARAFCRLGDPASGVRRNAEVWLSELIWREFYQMVLRRFPHVTDGPFVAAAADIAWRDAPEDFAAWSAGRTGYPIVDAAMRQLTTSGWMHNRLRMIAASFLTKDLLIDWRSGERFFERWLCDADLAANNGGWQWAASTGTDAVPYFRVFNPITQGERFDPHGRFVRAMLPELDRVPDRFVHAPWTMPPDVAHSCGVRVGTDYPLPIVDHQLARLRAIGAYAPVLGRATHGSR